MGGPLGFELTVKVVCAVLKRIVGVCFFQVLDQIINDSLVGSREGHWYAVI